MQSPHEDHNKGDKGHTYGSIAWTVINLFDSSFEPNVGQWKLPIYKPPTTPDIDVRDISKLEKIPNSVLCMRIALPKDNYARMKL